MCSTTYNVRILYICDDHTMQRIYIHLGHHRHHLKVGGYRHSHKKINALIEEYIDWTLQATISKIVMEASKGLQGVYLLCSEADPSMVFTLQELDPIFDICKELNLPSLKNWI